MRNIIKNTILLLILLLFLVTSINVSAELTTDTHNVDINNIQEGIQVIELYEITNTGLENQSEIDVWIQQSATDITILINEIEISPTVSANTYTCNLSKNNIDFLPNEAVSIKISYILPTEGETYFEKTLNYDTTFLSVTFNDKELYRGENQLVAGSSVRLLLYRPSEAPIDFTIIIIAFVVVVLIIIVTLYLLRKQRSKVRRSIVESEELLKIKKALLMESLKEIEKNHRSEDISDDTYSKLKDEYKQQAVEVMKKLDDLK